jgi:ADP-ribosylglycohydrolase
MLLELAVGDAYGAGFEYAPEMAQHNNLSRSVRHPRHRIIPGAYTNDTQMSPAIAELIVSGADWTPLNIANAFVTAFKRDPRRATLSASTPFCATCATASNTWPRYTARVTRVGRRCALRPSASMAPSRRSSSEHTSRPRLHTTHRMGSTPPSPQR